MIHVAYQGWGLNPIYVDGMTRSITTPSLNWMPVHRRVTPELCKDSSTIWWHPFIHLGRELLIEVYCV